jgi:hypothetical protein
MMVLPPLAPCAGYRVPLCFPDVEPDVLAREEAGEASALFASSDAGPHFPPGMGRRTA